MKTTLSCVVLLLSAITSTGPAALPAAAEAGPLVGEWSDLSRLEFTGLQTYTPEQIRKALAKHVPFLNAAHPHAPRRGLLPALSEHVRAGYLASGFSEVRVQSRLDPAARRIRINVTEGRRYRCGDIRVRGAVSISVPELTRRLTESWPPDATNVLQPGVFSFQNTYLDSAGQEVQPIAPVWVRDSFVNSSAPNLTALKQRVSQVLADCGYFFAQVDVRLLPQPLSGLAELEIAITNEGPHQQLGRIEIHGLKRHSPESVIRWLGLAPGQPIEPDLVARIEQKLWNSARFTHYRVVPAPGAGAQQPVQLDLWLTEAERGPLVDEDFSPAEHAVLKFRERLQTQLRFADRMGEDLVIALPQVPGLPEDFGALEVILSPQGLLAVNRRETNVRAAFVLSSDRRIFYSARRGQKIVATSPGAQINVFLSLRPNAPDETNPHSLNFGASLSSSSEAKAGTSPLHIDVLLAPATFLAQLYEKTPSIRLDGDRLMVGDEELGLEVEATTGRILKVRGVLFEKKALTLRFEHGAFARVAAEVEAAAAATPNLFEPGHTASSLLRVLGTEFLAGPYFEKFFPEKITRQQRSQAAAAIDKILARAPLAALDRWLSGSEPAENFVIPLDLPAGNTQANSLAAILTLLLQGAEELFPTQSWPSRLLREVACAGSGQAPYLAATAESIASSAESGPLTLWGASAVLGLFDKPSGGALARRGLARLTVADFQHDCRLLFEAQSGLAATTEALAAGLRDLSADEITALAAVLPAELGPHLRRAWEALVARPAEPLATVLQPMLDDVWSQHLRSRAEVALRELAGNAVNAAEAERLFNEGARHFTAAPGPMTDLAAGARLIQQAAELGHPKAECLYAQLLTNGTGVARDTAIAFEWHRRAANHGIIESQMAVGTAYQLGLDVAADPAEAFFWFSLAAIGGHKPAESLRIVAQRKLTPEQLTAVETRLKAAVNPEPIAPKTK